MINTLHAHYTSKKGEETAHRPSMMPASWIIMHPATRRSSSTSLGSPSFAEGVDMICSALARG